MIIFSRVSDTGGKRANSQLVTFINGCCKGHAVSLDVHPHPKACLPLLGAPPPFLCNYATPHPPQPRFYEPLWERGCKHAALVYHGHSEDSH